ncbi:MAG: sulfatase [Pirellulaceae bacterium]|nr:sulfatase [Pirellulaceae bacterium]
MSSIFRLWAWGMTFVLGYVLLSPAAAATHPNVILILSDDHRYDFLGFMEQAPEFLETPHLDRMAAQGAHLRNAFVTTSLCSPSRASILTGQFMHKHRVVDNQRPVAEGTRFFPELLQAAGYRTGFVGKWHMGHEHDKPRPGFEHWCSFPGQGVYMNPTLNINGRRNQFEGYNSDVLTDQAIEWLKQMQQQSAPFFLMLSFKAVHFPFQPAPRHQERYAKAKIDLPETMANSEENYQTQPRWVRDRRYSIHGIDHMQTGPFDKDPVPSLPQLYRDYAAAVHGLDQNIGRVLNFLDDRDLTKETLVIYLGDNGFALGEHGFYDKRDAFEASIRIPMLALAPGLIPPQTQIDQMVANIDLAPTILDFAGVDSNLDVDGKSFAPLLKRQPLEWRDHLLYEYHWEWNFPATPTLFAMRSDRYKYIFYHGVWDQNGFYDLQTDPHERHNLIRVPAYQQQIAEMRRKMFNELEARDALDLPVRRPAGDRLDDRKLRR